MRKVKPRYTPAPPVAAAQSERLGVMLEVLAGKLTVAEGARRLGLSRNHFQTLLHRGLAGLVASITPKSGGRPAKAPQIVALEAEVARLQRENARLLEQVGTTGRILQAASGLLQGRLRPARQVRTRKTPAGSDDDQSDGEPHRWRRCRLAEVEAMKRTGLSAALAAAIAGVHESTVRRWKKRLAAPQTPRRGPRACVEAQARDQVIELVRRLKGQVGAESLRHSVAGVSRREAARIKAQTLTAMERERKAALRQVRVAMPGVMRGLDAMVLPSAEGRLYALIAADAAVPYRTAVKTGRHYDAELVEHTLAWDLAHNGAPLVYRFDRASAHQAPRVRMLLDAHQVLILHGPPCCPRFYGQLERQNREHRVWAGEWARLGQNEIEACLQEMLLAVNALWRRRTLGWKTASELWTTRPALVVDRQALREEVNERAVRIGQHLQSRGKPADLAQRLAIEQALETRGYLRQTPEGWC